MRFRTVLSRLAGGTLLLLVVLGWVYIAPTQIGGSTTYVVTSGISMEPRFHTGDLVLLRPAADYRVGEIVAYHSTAWRMVVMHRIIARHGNRYVFKGDNNNFIDPDYPSRSQLIGRLWLHIPHAGVVLYWLHTPAIAAVLAGGVAMLLLFGGARRRGRRARRRRGGGKRAAPARAAPAMTAVRDQALGHINEVLAVVAAVVVAFLALGLVAFTAPTGKTVSVRHVYTQSVSFGYQAHARAGPVYPGGIVRTGAPIFTALVQRIAFTVAYQFSADAPGRIEGTVGLTSELASSTGWSHSAQLGPPARFVGDRARARLIVDLPQLNKLIAQVTAQTGDAMGDQYSLTITARVQVAGTLAGQPVSTTFSPGLSFALGGLQVVPGGASTGSAGQSGGLDPHASGSVATPATIQNTLGIGSFELPVAIIRWLALAGIALAGGGTLLALRWKRAQPIDATASIHARYRHLIVSIGAMRVDPTRPSIAVTSIDALARLAERSERLILHQHRDGFDSYFVDDEGTLYRYEHDATEPAAQPSVAGDRRRLKATAAIPGPTSEPSTPKVARFPPPVFAVEHTVLNGARAAPPASAVEHTVPNGAPVPPPASAGERPGAVKPLARQLLLHRGQRAVERLATSGRVRPRP
ncbi:MAG: signal peptidase I [Solirubrobacteraceae bacterium]